MQNPTPINPIDEMLKTLIKQSDDKDEIGHTLRTDEYHDISALLKKFSVEDSAIEGVDEVILQAEKRGFALGVRYGMQHLANFQEWIR